MAEDPRNEALAAEHAAVWTYGVLAARTSASAQPALLRLLRRHHDAHTLLRDTLLTAIAADGAEPAVALASYPLPARLTTPSAIRAAAIGVEEDCNDAHAWVVSQLVSEPRRPFVAALTAGATRTLALGGGPSAFPGAADLAQD